MKTINRRDFLKLLGTGFLTLGGLLGLGGLFRFLAYQSDPVPPSEFDLGPADLYPLGSKTILTEVPAVILHTESGFRALSLSCTHLGCRLDSDEQGFACPCHGSRFDVDGEVIRGPADRPLPKLLVEQTADGSLILHTKF